MVPTLGADHGGALCDAPQRLPQVAAPAHKWHLEVVLVYVVRVVRRRQHLPVHITCSCCASGMLDVAQEQAYAGTPTQQSACSG